MYIIFARIVLHFFRKVRFNPCTYACVYSVFIEIYMWLIMWHLFSVVHERHRQALYYTDTQIQWIHTQQSTSAMWVHEGQDWIINEWHSALRLAFWLYCWSSWALLAPGHVASYNNDNIHNKNIRMHIIMILLYASVVI